MSHEIEELETGEAAMVSGEGITPWHGLGTVVEGLLTASEALQLAHLDWTVEKHPDFQRRLDGTFVEVPDRFLIVRSSDEKVLGNVGGDYKPFQNDEAFSFFDTVVDKTGEAHYTSAGSLFGGKRVFLTAKIGDTFQVAGSDAHDLYLLIMNSHDGSKSFTAVTTMIRAVCNNTVTLGLQRAKSSWKLNHKVTLEGKAAEARDALKLTYKYSEEFDREVQKLLAVDVTADQFREIVDGLLPEQKRQKERNIEELLGIFTSEPTVVDTSAAGNGWGAVNAATFWTDHARGFRTDEARFKSLTNGFASRFRNGVASAVLELA